jgi:glucan phosphoethanolaminetransferase (alkaline phosphatase superfamily)
MSVFDFGRKQRLGVDLYGHTSGREIFNVDEYNNSKKLTVCLVLIMLVIFSAFYFEWTSIPIKIKIFMGLIFLGCSTLGYFNIKKQIRIRESLY